MIVQWGLKLTHYYLGVEKNIAIVFPITDQKYSYKLLFPEVEGVKE